MQCPSCQFENMPGSGRCARCGASLALASAAIDVHPPRAGRLSRLELGIWRLRNAAMRLASKMAPAIRVFAARESATHFDLTTLLRCIVPGWPQYRRGDRPRAFVFLFSYLAFLLPGLVLTGTLLGSLLLGLAVAMHIAAICDAIVTVFATPSDRIAFTLVAGLMLFFLIYLPTGWLVSRVATPISINASIPPFQRGEVLWYSRIATLQVGDLVVYTLPSIRAQGRTAGGGAANYVFQGQWIGRVIAMPGQTVSLDTGQWLIDGHPNDMQLLSSPALNDGASWTVPAGTVFILPEGLVPDGAQISTDVLQQVYVTPMARVAGRLYFRSLPWSQMSRL